MSYTGNFTTTGTTVTLTWDPYTNTDYDFWVFTNLNSSPPIYDSVRIRDQAVNTYTFSYLPSGTTWPFNFYVVLTDNSQIRYTFPDIVGTIPGHPSDFTYDVSASTCVMNFRGNNGSQYYQIIEGFSTNVPQAPTGVFTDTTYTFVGLQPSTNYQSLIQASVDGVHWSLTIPFNFTTLAPGTLSMIQTSSTPTTAQVQVTPFTSGSATYTMTTTAGSVTPSGSQSADVLVYTNTGLLAGQSAVMTYTPSAGSAISQTVLSRPPGLPSPYSAYYDGQTSFAYITWGALPTSPIAGSPYVFASATPDLPSQPVYPAVATGYTSNGKGAFACAPNIGYILHVGFGQDDIGGTEGEIVSVAMSEYYIVSVINNVVTFNTFNSVIAPTLTITGPGGPFTYNSVVSPFRVPSGVLTNGATYTFRLHDGTTTSSQVVTAKASSGGASATWFFSP